MKNKNIIKKIMLHPFFIGIFPILFLYGHNVNEVFVSETILPFLVVVGVTTLLLLLLMFILENLHKAGLILSGSLLYFFSYGHILDFVKGNDLAVVLIMSILFLVFSFFIAKTKKNLENATITMNVFSTFLVASSFFTISNQLKTIISTPDVYYKEQSQRITSLETRTPDIYYLIFDRYGNIETLKNSYNFDNSKFTTYLSQKGFYVADKSTSNYLKTGHSLASSLNMEYINFLADELGEDSTNLLPLYDMLQDYKVWRMLKERKYTFIHFGSWWKNTSFNPYADNNYNLYPLPEFSMLLYQTTAAYPVGSQLLKFDQYKLQWKRVYYEFEKLQEIPKIEQPTFVFAHILVPHNPFVFDRDGNYITHEDRAKKSQRDGYVDQVIFINKKIKELVDTLLADKNKRNHPIIIIQGDEGFFPKRYSKRQEEGFDDFDWTKATPQELKEKMSILNAYYFPGVDVNKVLYPTITPANSFRLVFNLYFNTNYDLMPDKNYIFSDDLHPYRFEEVTDKLNIR